MKLKLILAGLVFSASSQLFAQTSQSSQQSSQINGISTKAIKKMTVMAKADITQKPAATMQMDMPADTGNRMKVMVSGMSLNLPMSRDGSGTSWLPDASAMHAIMFNVSSWQLMTHYNIFLRYNNQDIFRKGSRGSAKFDAPNMGMLMGQHQVGKNGLFHFSIMMSLDPLTVQGGGYPLLFQTGESWKGTSLVDRQHPHDLFSEVAVSYTQALSPNTDFSVYLGYPGEPALGPVTFMHRPSGMYGPDAPIGHHWQDATHITFGVATLGFRFHDLKIEGSSFTGREPNENRYNFDKPRFDSYSARLSYNPSKNWALQVSRGFIKSPEALNPDENVTRTTASANYAIEYRPGNFITANLVYGLNQSKGLANDPSIGLEGAIEFGTTSIYTRYEWVKKSFQELQLDRLVLSMLPFYTQLPSSKTLYSINAFTLGFNKQLFHLGKTNVAIGAQATLNVSPEALQSLYGKTPIAGEVFLRIFPALMKMHNHSTNSMKGMIM